MLSIIFLLIALYIFAQIGGALGNSGYRGKARMQLAEAKILVALLAKVAKSDGYVSESEAAMISEILDDLVRQIISSRKKTSQTCASSPKNITKPTARARVAKRG